MKKRIIAMTVSLVFAYPIFLAALYAINYQCVMSSSTAAVYQKYYGVDQVSNTADIMFWFGLARGNPLEGCGSTQPTALWYLVFVLVLLTMNVWLAIDVSNFAQSKGYDKVGFWFLTFFLPLVGVILVFVFKARDEIITNRNDLQSPSSQTARCPYCGENIRIVATICRYCDKSVDQQFKMLRSQLGID
jgi:hypothetical protein